MFHGQVEGTDFVVLDPRFRSCYAGHVRVERLWSGARWCEGPAWFAAGRYLVWSDIPNNRMMRCVEPSGEVSVFREPSNNTNGHTVDNQGRLVSCEHLTRRVTRTEITGKITVLAGGDEGLFNTHRDALQAMGGKIFYMGPLGSAAIIKVITNMLAFIHLVADGEALMLAKRGGLDLGRAWEAITASSGSSFVHETEGQLILNGSYDIAFTMDLALKDLGFAMQFGREFGVPLDLAGLTNQTFVKGRAAYGGQAQSTQIVKLLEDVLATDLRAPGYPARLE